jgi:hypothetical protein
LVIRWLLSRWKLCIFKQQVDITAGFNHYTFNVVICILKKKKF